MIMVSNERKCYPMDENMYVNYSSITNLIEFHQENINGNLSNFFTETENMIWPDFFPLLHLFR